VIVLPLPIKRPSHLFQMPLGKITVPCNALRN
jgi:hypothetical protein